MHGSLQCNERAIYVKEDAIIAIIDASLLKKLKTRTIVDAVDVHERHAIVADVDAVDVHERHANVDAVAVHERHAIVADVRAVADVDAVTNVERIHGNA